MAEPPTAAAPTDPPPDRPPAEPEAAPLPEPAPPPVPPPSRWQLRRSVRDRKLTGVAGGVAAAADIDATLVRLLFAVAALTGWGIVAYVVLAIVLRDESVDDPARPLPREQRRMLRIGLGVAAAIAMGRLFDGWFLDGPDFGFPFLLIAVGAAVLWARRDQRPNEPLGAAQPPAASGEEVGAGWPAPAPPPAWATTTATPPPLGAGIAWRSTGHDLLRLAAAFVAVGAFLALLAGTAMVVLGAVPMRLPLLPAALGTAGLLALVVAVVRRAALPALLVSGGVLVVAAALAVGLASFPGGAGNRVVVIGPSTPLLDRYEHGAGRLVLDLHDLSLASGDKRRVVAKVGTGQLTVIVPPAVNADVRARVGAGNATVFGREQSGPGVDVTGRHQGQPTAGLLDLDLDVGLGQIEVELTAPTTYDVLCDVPADPRGDGTDDVICPHPAPLATSAMSCSVTLADPETGADAGRAFCRQEGSTVPAAGSFAASCSVPADDDKASCAPLSPPQRQRLEALRQSTGPATTATTAAPAGGGGAPLDCGPPDAAGVRTCTTAPASSTTTSTPTSYRCTEDPATRQLSCVPA